MAYGAPEVILSGECGTLGVPESACETPAGERQQKPAGSRRRDASPPGTPEQPARVGLADVSRAERKSSTRSGHSGRTNVGWDSSSASSAREICRLACCAAATSCSGSCSRTASVRITAVGVGEPWDERNCAAGDRLAPPPRRASRYAQNGRLAPPLTESPPPSAREARHGRRYAREDGRAPRPGPSRGAVGTAREPEPR